MSPGLPPTSNYILVLYYGTANKHFSLRIMSHTSTTSSSSDFQSLFNTALREYQAKTKTDLQVHPLAAQLRNCDSPTAILAVLQNLVHKFYQCRNGNERLTKCLNTTVNVLHSICPSVGTGVGLVLSSIWIFSGVYALIYIFQVFPHAKVIFTRIGVLLLVCTFFVPSYMPLWELSIRRPRKFMWVKPH